MVTRAAQTGVLGPGGWQRVQAPLHFPEKPPVAGSAVQLGVCTGGVSQRFIIAGGAISTTGEGGTKLCVSAPNVKSSTLLKLAACKPGDMSQLFTYGSAKLPKNVRL